MKITKRLSDTGASEAELIQLAAENGFTLPEFNGGRPEPSGFSYKTLYGKSDSAVRYFLTLDEHEERYTIREFLDRYINRIPQKTLPIACDSFGNLVLLDAGALSTGAVWFWDHEKESMDEPTWDNMAVIAPSFTEFLSALE